MSKNLITQISIGTIIGEKYRIEKLLGSGGMGLVWQAHHIGLRRNVAIKVLHPRFSIDQESRKRFRKEAQIAALFNHPNAVRIFDFGEYQNNLYLVMEKLTGESLRHHLSRVSSINLQEFLDVAIGLAETIAVAHEINLIHRDLKPENIFLCQQKIAKTNTYKTTAKILDFGLAVIKSRKNMERLTLDSLIIGTPDYMSPEQAAGKEVTSASDIYSLGVIIFEVLTGELPFSGTPSELIAKHITKSAPSIQSVQPGIPMIINDLISESLEKDAEKRPTIHKFRECFLWLLQQKESQKTKNNTRETTLLTENSEYSKTEHISNVTDHDIDFNEDTVIINNPLYNRTEDLSVLAEKPLNLFVDFEEEPILSTPVEKLAPLNCGPKKVKNRDTDTNLHFIISREPKALRIKDTLVLADEQTVEKSSIFELDIAFVVEIAILEKNIFKILSNTNKDIALRLVAKISHETSIVFAPGAREDDLIELVCKGYIVIADAFPTDTKKIQWLYEQGVYDFARRPMQMDKIIEIFKRASEFYSSTKENL